MLWRLALMANDPASTETYRAFPDVHRFPLGESQVLVSCPLTHAVRRISTPSFRLLQQCRTFAPLAEHADRISRERSFGTSEREALRAELEALAAAGLLVSRQALLDRGAARRQDEAPPPITMVGIPTCARPRSLHACLLSHLESARRHGRTLDFVVLDDSPRPEARDENQHVVREVAGRFGATLHYADAEGRERYATELAREAGLSPEGVRFGIINDLACPIATGANRNALLLHAVGEAILSVDDDVLAQPVSVPEAGSELALTSVSDPTEFWFFSEDFPPGPGPQTTADLIGLHETVLGHSAANLLAAAGSAANLETANASFFRRLEAGGRVLTTAAGLVGDSGMGSPLGLLTLDGPSRSRFLASEAIYRRTLADRQVVRAVTRPTICETAFCMAPNLGLDNRDLLPPFLPVQRNQDGVFGAVLRACNSGFAGFLPWTVPHQPPVPRIADPAALWERAARPHTGHLVLLLVSAFSAGPGIATAAERQRALGRSLEELGSCDLAEFEEQVRLHLWNALSRHATHLESLLKRFGGHPDFWAADVRRVLLNLWQHLPSAESAVPWDLADAFGTDRARELFRLIVRRHGRLLQDWPALVQAARRLRNRDVRPARSP
jgi:hypothetical protein